MSDSRQKKAAKVKAKAERKTAKEKAGGGKKVPPRRSRKAELAAARKGREVEDRSYENKRYGLKFPKGTTPAKKSRAKLHVDDHVSIPGHKGVYKLAGGVYDPKTKSMTNTWRNVKSGKTVTTNGVPKGTTAVKRGPGERRAGGGAKTRPKLRVIKGGKA